MQSTGDDPLFPALYYDRGASMKRCPWCETDDLLRSYHDDEWGVPVHDDRKHFEFLILEGAQAGLSWLTVLRRREYYREAYHDFDPTIVARYTDKEIETLMSDAGIIRNRRKIEASINNAKLLLDMQHELGSFDTYIWSFVEDKPVVHNWQHDSQIPSQTPVSNELSKDLKKRGFKFVGPTIMYAHMQATGLVNDHIASCFRYKQLLEGR